MPVHCVKDHQYRQSRISLYIVTCQNSRDSTLAYGPAGSANLCQETPGNQVEFVVSHLRKQRESQYCIGIPRNYTLLAHTYLNMVFPLPNSLVQFVSELVRIDKSAVDDLGWGLDIRSLARTTPSRLTPKSISAEYSRGCRSFKPFFNLRHVKDTKCRADEALSPERKRWKVGVWARGQDKEI